MFEKVNRHHPDKIADRIAGAIVDVAYRESTDPKVACEVLIGHGKCTIINETSEFINPKEVENIVHRIAGEDVDVNYIEVPQDKHLSDNQVNGFRCGDNGIFKGVDPSKEEIALSNFARYMDYFFDSDGKYIIADNTITVCQSDPSGIGLERLEAAGYDIKDIPTSELIHRVATNVWNLQDPFSLKKKPIRFIINPLGDWTGGISVDSGATNRKLGSDMGRGVTGGGLHGKDLSKADVSLNIYAFYKAIETGEPAELWCSIGDDIVDGKTYSEIVKGAKKIIYSVGGFEKFAEYGLF